MRTEAEIRERIDKLNEMHKVAHENWPFHPHPASLLEKPAPVLWLEWVLEEPNSGYEL